MQTGMYDASFTLPMGGHMDRLSDALFLFYDPVKDSRETFELYAKLQLAGYPARLSRSDEDEKKGNQ